MIIILVLTLKNGKKKKCDNKKIKEKINKKELY